MKNLFIILMFLSTNIFAYEVPKDAVIKVYSKEGKLLGNMTRQQYKVVLIEDKSTSKETPRPIVVQRKEETKKNNNEVIVHAGMGKYGLTGEGNAQLFKVREKDTAVGGLTYCRSFICGSVFTNELYTLGVRIGF